MAKELIKIVLSETDIKELVAEKWGLDSSTCVLHISYWKGDQREPESLVIDVEGQKAKSNNKLINRGI